jgi:hypothetical protein
VQTHALIDVLLAGAVEKAGQDMQSKFLELVQVPEA